MTGHSLCVLRLCLFLEQMSKGVQKGETAVLFERSLARGLSELLSGESWPYL